MTLLPLGDSAVVMTLGDTVDADRLNRVRSVAAGIAQHPPGGVIEVVPAFASIAVFFEPHVALPYDELCRELLTIARQAAGTTADSMAARRIEIPVVYGGEHGPDLPAVAAHTGLGADEVIARHSSAEYQVHAIGFVPGFPYLGGLPPELATPRRPTPRPRVPRGSVGIGGAQTGIYSLDTPGGWNLIGRTPLELFDPARTEPALLRLGDHVKFVTARAEAVQARPQKMSSPPLAPPELAADRESGESPRLEVLRGGLFTTVQDLGRRGHRAAGVPLSGAADPFALRLANLLVGNPENAAALEFTLVGPHLRFSSDAVVALGGGDFGGPDRWRPFRVRAGSELRLGAARSGCRGYLAVAGGIAVQPVLGSASTYVRAGIGGFAGRTLRDGDVLPLVQAPRKIRDRWRIDERILPKYGSTPEVRIMTGARREDFDALCRAGAYRVTPQADRMGVRLTGTAITRRRPDALSSPVAPGTVQLPSDGQPIVLLADAQTIGGYSQAGYIASVDIPLVAQLRPGDEMRFVPVSGAEAREAWLAREHALSLLQEGLAQKLA